MTPENFCYWLRGHFELNEGQPLSAEQSKMIAEHLKLVFKKVTPPLNPTEPLPIYPRPSFIDTAGLLIPGPFPHTATC